MKRLFKKRNVLRVCAAALCVCAALNLSGCAVGTAISKGKGFPAVMDAVKEDLFGLAQQPCRQLSLTLPLRAGYNPVEIKPCYESLTDPSMKEVYEQIEENLYQISTEVDEDTGFYVTKYTQLPSGMSFEDIYIVKEAVLRDHPEAFWVLSTYDVRENFHDGKYLVLYSKYSHMQIRAAYEKINAVTEDIFSRIPDNASELERETVIHDALVDMVEYDVEAAESDDSTADAFNMYGALVKKKAVCSGYACAAKMLLNRVGVECREVMGMSKNAGHMWNQVKINGRWYHLDVTWDDPSVEQEIVYARYYYFNLPDERIQKDHKIGKNIREMTCEYSEDGGHKTTEPYNFDLEPCDAIEENYYTTHAAKIDALNDAAVTKITEKMVDASKTKESMIYLLVDSNISGEDAEAWLSNNSGGKYPALVRSMTKANYYGIGARVKTCVLLRMYEGNENDVWPNLYGVRLTYA